LLSRRALGLWAAEFYATNTPARARAIHRLLDLLLGRRLAALLATHQPDLVISTTSLLTDAVLRALARRRRAAPFAMLFADAQQLHATWLTARAAAATLAPTRESYQEALAAGFAPERLHLTGWPVRSQFAHAGASDRAATLRRLQLDPERFTVFVQGGREGTANVVRAVESALHSSALQVVLAAGTNGALLERFHGIDRVRAIPFTPQVAPLMAAADVVLGKAGPNVLFEAVTLGKPFIATARIPGQETGNLAMIERYGLGWVALEPRQQRALLAGLAGSPARLAEQARSVARYRAWNSAAAEAIEPLLRDLALAGARAYGLDQAPAGQQTNAAVSGNR
jgi:UDP-N-acetylglucosamine:LPS N-acetylglucosamine transferase